MKCAKHPRVDAVGVCIACGVGVCRDCEVRVLGRTHCKPCVEAGRAHYTPATPAITKPAIVTPVRRAPPVPKPTGPPNRAFFIGGFVGMILLMATSMISWFFDTTRLFFSGLFGLPSLFTTISLILVCSSIVLTSFAFYGYRRNYGSRLSQAIFFISLIFPWFLLVSNLLFYTGNVLIPYQHPLNYYWFHTPGPLFSLGLFLYVIGLLLIGVMFILWGSVLIVIRRYTGNEGLPIAASILFILAGSFWCSAVLYFVGAMLLIPAGIVWLISLARSKIPAASAYQEASSDS